MPPRNLPLLDFNVSPEQHDYKSRTPGRSSHTLPPNIIRQQHGRSLQRKMNAVEHAKQQINSKRQSKNLPANIGIVVEFESFPAFDLIYESLDAYRSGIELLSVKENNTGATIASVFIPDNKISFFLRKIDSYINRDDRFGNAVGKNLIEGISNIQRATIKGLWTDSEELFPDTTTPIWWEVWLSTFNRLPNDVISHFKACANIARIEYQDDFLHLKDRIVVLVHGTINELSECSELFGFMAEVRKAKDTAESITQLATFEQSEFINDLINRTQPAGDESPAVCILDTGVNYGHSLLRDHLLDDKVFAYNDDWGVTDHNIGAFAGHGTRMAGLALYGDLTPLMASGEPLSMEHHVESVKILPENEANDPLLYGQIVRGGIEKVNTASPYKNRVYSMAVTADDRDRGYASSWSTAIDRLTAGVDDNNPKLMFISAGNVDPENYCEYPRSCTSSSVKDPAQAWNAVTVGAFTNFCSVSDQYPEYVPIARTGELSPTSCSSAEWDKSNTPIKPDIVMEGGNIAEQKKPYFSTQLDSLSLLTTGHDVANAPLVPVCETSAAVSQAARYGAIIQARYPLYRPETIRALLIHSANWTDEMKSQFPGTNKEEKENLLRHCGYGVPNINRALYCASNDLTLVAESELVPFKRGDHFNEWNVHHLPWPVEELYALADTEIEMKVTLSYFIDALPGRRGYHGKFSYPSHRLGFKLKRVGQTQDGFLARQNGYLVDRGIDPIEGQRHDWFLGNQLHTRGSIISDTWKGSAFELAESNSLVVFPKGGWWRKCLKQRCYDNIARYSLVISISTPSEDVDLYNLISSQIEVMSETEINI
ncbi:S8 family peptidase [Maridesulfovibrio sp.]|uniref:S8 family peptidase n=2 Tax=Maridesulfovibrio sp. TaxID=2795000 RepID=UPI0037483CA1